MAIQKISLLLKQTRSLLGMKGEDVVEQLKSRGINISVKTLYGYENSVSMPNVNTFIALCDIYRIENIKESLGYEPDNETVIWHRSQYEDYFRANSIEEKAYLLKRWGIPSFDEYKNMLKSDPLIGSLTKADHELIAKYHAAVESDRRAVDLILEKYAETT